ncbi:MAG: transglutaminase-like cysteine peptidase [Proteobacteria bacterium]|nr:transglutaminase-like cysteine peptidase [Pseudomonadota bacterium]
MSATWRNAARAEPAPVRIALAPPHGSILAEPPNAKAPFGLTSSALAATPAQAMTAKWQAMQATFAIETRVMNLCRQMPDACSPAAVRFMAIVDAARAESGRARAGLINRAVNLAIRPMRDSAQFGVADVWQSPLMTFASGAGDCEDYAIAKYVALRQAGMSADDLKLVIVHDARSGEDHAVTAARVDGDWLILDNRRMLLLTDAQTPELKPLIALGEEAPKPVLVRDVGLDVRFAVMASALG